MLSRPPSRLGGCGIWAVDSQEYHQKCCHQMSDLKAKMHQNLFQQGLSTPPDVLAGF